MSLTSPLCRVGRKKPIEKTIKSLAPKNFNIYVEPFVGSGDIYFFLDLDDNIKSVLNDKDKLITDAFKIMKSNPNIDNIERFKNKSLEEVKKYVKQSHSGLDRLAQIIYILCGTFGSKGIGDIYKNPNIEPKLRRIPQYAEYMKNTTILNGDYKNTFKYDSKNTFFFLDPPYEKSKGIYKDPIINYEELKDKLKNIKGKFILTINDSNEIIDLFKDFNIRRITVKGGTENKTSDIGDNVRKELIIKNY